MPDGTYPNITLVEGLLNCINSLNITIENLESSDLEKVMSHYADG